MNHILLTWLFSMYISRVFGMVVGGVFYAYIVGSIAVLVQGYDPIRKATQERLHQVCFMSCLIASRVLNITSHWPSGRMGRILCFVQVDHFLAARSVPLSLQAEIRECVFSPVDSSDWPPAAPRRLNCHSADTLLWGRDSIWSGTTHQYGHARRIMMSSAV